MGLGGSSGCRRRHEGALPRARGEARCCGDAFRGRATWSGATVRCWRASTAQLTRWRRVERHRRRLHALPLPMAHVIPSKRWSDGRACPKSLPRRRLRLAAASVEAGTCPRVEDTNRRSEWCLRRVVGSVSAPSSRPTGADATHGATPMRASARASRSLAGRHAENKGSESRCGRMRARAAALGSGTIVLSA